MPINFLPSRVAVHAVGLLRGAGMTSATCAAAATRAAAVASGPSGSLRTVASPSGVSAAAGSLYSDYGDRTAGHTGSFILFRHQPQASAATTQEPLPRIAGDIASEVDAAAPNAAFAWMGSYVDALPPVAATTADAQDAKLAEVNAAPGVWHVVLFTLGGTAADGVMLPLLAQRCRDEIPGCLMMHYGPIVDATAAAAPGGTPTAAPEFTHALVSKMASAEALRVYATHPIHMDLVSEMRRLSKAPPVALDY